jgi:hypothetical protein
MRKQSESILLGILLTAFMVSTIATPKMLVHFTVGGTAGDGGGKAGTTLSAYVTATACWTRTFSWTIEKFVEPDYWEFYPGGSGTSTYTITVTKDEGTDAYFINGTVSVTNGGERATEDLTITIELRDGVSPPNDLIATASVDVSSNPVLDPGETGEYPYTITIPSGDVHTGGTYKITAKVTITNHSGYPGEPFGPSPSNTTTLPSSPTLINNEIHVYDNGGLWTFSSSGSVTYDKIFTCKDKGENVNTATILETGQSASVTVTVTCKIPPEATISGVKFHDVDADGVRDDNEEGLEGWTIQLWKFVDGNWKLVGETTTDSKGYYIFTVTESGHYKVTEVLESGWMQTAPADGCYEFDVALGDIITGLDFGNIKLGSISGAKFYDANVNGVWDSGEPPIKGWKAHLTGTNIRGDTIDVYAFTGADGKFVFKDLLPGTYTVEEVFPSGMWISTTATLFSHELEEGEDYVGPDFGNVCLMQGTGGRTLGFWSNKNGQALITSSDVTELNALNLYKPTGWAYPPFSTSSLSTARTQIKNYLLNATGKDMRWMLSAQLIATKLNVLHGFLSGSTIVYVGSSTYVPSGFISIDEIMENANTALAGTDRAAQEYWKNLLDGLNNNRLPFVCTEPCYPIVYP